jgi:hypothetical protein
LLQDKVKKRAGAENNSFLTNLNIHDMINKAFFSRCLLAGGF